MAFLRAADPNSAAMDSAYGSLLLHLVKPSNYSGAVDNIDLLPTSGWNIEYTLFLTGMNDVTSVFVQQGTVCATPEAQVITLVNTTLAITDTAYVSRDRVDETALSEDFASVVDLLRIADNGLLIASVANEDGSIQLNGQFIRTYH